MKKEQQKMNNWLTKLQQYQRQNGSFDNSIIITTLIFSCLDSAKNSNNIKKKAASFLLSQKQKNCLFGADKKNNICASFLAISVLYKYKPKIISGKDIAKILMILTKIEVNEGGPYYSSFPSSQRHIDLSINIIISYFLSLQKVELPNLKGLIETAIDNNNFNSKIFASPYINTYLISQFYQGQKIKKIIKFILNKKPNNILDCLLINATLLNFSYPINIFSNKLNNQEKRLKKLCRFYKKKSSATENKICLNSPALSIALHLKIINKLSVPARKNKRKHEKQFCKIAEKIKKRANQRNKNLQKNLKEEFERAIEKTIKKDKTKEIYLLPLFFKLALKKEDAEKISEEMVVKLGFANLCLWVTFEIYDDFLDEEGEPKTLPASNFCFREFISIMENIFPQNSEFHSIFHEIMDKIEGANTWETSNCRAKLNGLDLQIPNNLPVYKNFNKLYERSLAHSLGPLAILFSLGYKKKSKEIKNLLIFFQNFLIARQLNDDMHDWEKDLKNGHIDSVVAELMQKYPKKEINLIDESGDIAKLKKIFWFKVMPKISKKTLLHIKTAQKALKKIKNVENASFLEKLLEPAKYASQKALDDYEQTSQFLKTYKTN